MPVALALMALRFAWRASPRWRAGAWRSLAVAAAFALGLLPAARAAAHLAAARRRSCVAALLGAPVFVAMGGVALVLFFTRRRRRWPAVSAEIYRLIASPTLPAIPLLTACGYVLAESKRRDERLVRFFRALFGWMPGGIAVLVAAVCALFTTFTGGSGVTIIALGGLVYPILREDGYSEGFSLGLVTAAGSLGLLFPPSLPVILYSVVASVPPPTSSTSPACCRACCWSCSSRGYGVFVGRQVQTRGRRRSRGASSARRPGRPSGSCRSRCWSSGCSPAASPSLVETAAAALRLRHRSSSASSPRDIHLVRELPEVLLKAAALVGARAHPARVGAWG